MPPETKPYSSVDHLKTPEAIEEYLIAAFETDDPDLHTHAIGVVALLSHRTEHGMSAKRLPTTRRQRLIAEQERTRAMDQRLASYIAGLSPSDRAITLRIMGHTQRSAGTTRWTMEAVASLLAAHHAAQDEGRQDEAGGGG